MWKPVRLQGVGAASSVINANTHPAGKLDPWRQQVDLPVRLGAQRHAHQRVQSVDCGRRLGPASTLHRPTRSAGRSAAARSHGRLGCHAQRQPGRAVAGADPDGRYEGAGDHGPVEGRELPRSNPFAADTFPTGTTLLDGTTNAAHGCGPNTATAHNPFPSNFWCNPSSIDGLGITNSSQGGGGIFVHAWGHNLQIANNRVYNNPERCRAASTSARANIPPRTWEAPA